MKRRLMVVVFTGLFMLSHAQKDDLVIKGTKKLSNESTPLQSFELHGGFVQFKGPGKTVKRLTPEQVIYYIAKSIEYNEAYKGKNGMSIQPLVDSLSMYAQFYNPTIAETLKKWAVIQNYNLNTNMEVNYTVSFRKHYLKYYGLYKGGGTLAESKIEQTPVDLPSIIRKAMKKNLKQNKGYKISSATYAYYKNHELDMIKEGYEVVTKNKSAIKTFHFSPEGFLININ